MNDMTKIKNLTFISAYENLAPDNYCDRMIKAFDKLEKTCSASFGSDTNGKGVRKDFSFYFDEERNNTIPLAQETNKILDEGLAKYTNEYPSLAPLQYYSKVIKVQRTPPKGGFHAWHREHGVGEISHRILVWTIYLNDIPQGEGETEFLEYGMKVQPKKGTVCFFPAGFTHTHRGNAVYTHDKYIATGWYYLL
jgi:hypothetical protein|tara:strand:+ start:2544 stop:3125 length:582 start_codon:yes stop_codon:yes gene_type:complete